MNMFQDLSDQGLIKIQGVDAKKFLQGQLTCDVNALAQDDFCMGAHCNREGRVLCLFYLYHAEDAYYLLMQREMVAISISHLKKYSIFFKTEISDVSGNKMVIQSINTTHLQDHYHTIQAGIPTIYPDTSGKFLPHEINLHTLNAISFDKGCYTGQEIIARMHYRGQLKNQLYIATVASDFSSKPGNDIYTLHQNEWSPCGVIVDISNEIHDQNYSLLVIANRFLHDLFLIKDTQSVLTVKRK